VVREGLTALDTRFDHDEAAITERMLREHALAVGSSLRCYAVSQMGVYPA